ncbi:MAG: ROK family protein [Verrucomicrobiae bacterium]|nr:ROK family protein [Verrucomicrobiae bacterium]
MKPPLDPSFQPPILAHQQYSGAVRLVIALEREQGYVSRFETRIRPQPDAETMRLVERLVKFLLWSRGGWRLYLEGPQAVCERLTVRPFDAQLMERVYERPFQITIGEAPPARESAVKVGGYLDGCRLGFDLGASDYKIAAVRDGEVVFSGEFPWDPRNQPDPEYHFKHLNEGLRKAAAYLPRVDAIGGSSAGVIVNNRVMVASLFRAVVPEKFPAARDLFLRIRDTWKVPVEVRNDGDVTALAGGLSLGVNAVLGIAMGSSEAAGYLDRGGQLRSWLSELAFAPVDYNPEAPADEWSGDRGVGALYFSQQAVNRLLPAAGIVVPGEMGLPERLKHVQQLIANGDARPEPIYRTIGVYLGYTIPYYALFYDFDHLLVLGRVTTGQGGAILVETARKILREEFPALAAKVQIHLPDEKNRRVGQAVAAASLPALGAS